MPRRRLDKTLADYMVLAISPALIIAMVMSLTFFLVEVLYQGEFEGRANWVMFCYSAAIVLIARIAMEEGSERAGLFALPLAVAMWLVLSRFGYSSLPTTIVLGIVWWAAHQLTWDSTFIDERVDASGQGLLQVVGLDREGPEDTGDPVSPSKGQDKLSSKENHPPSAASWWNRFQAWRERRRKQHTPGIWAVYFSLAALPMFGVGQAFMPAGDLLRRRYVFQLVLIYLAAGLGLLLTTSFLGLRRYLRQRKLEMPKTIAATWLGLGGALAVGLLAAATLIPRPNAEYALSSFSGSDGAPRPRANQISPLRDRPGEGPGAASKQPSPQQSPTGPNGANPGQGNNPGQSTQNGSSSGQQPSGGGQQPSGSSGSSPGSSIQGQSGGGGQKPGGGQTQNGGQNPSGNQSQGQPKDGGSPKDPSQNGGEKSPSSPQPNQGDQPPPGQSGNQSGPSTKPQQQPGQPANSGQPTSDQKSPADNPQPPQPAAAPPPSPTRGEGDRGGTKPPPPSQPAASPPPQPPASQIQWPDLGGGLTMLFRWALNFALAAAAIYLLWKYWATVRQYCRELLAALRALWARLFGGGEDDAAESALAAPTVAPRHPFAAFADPFASGLAGRYSPNQLVCYTFAALQAWAEEQNCPRRPEATPLEFAAVLGRQHQVLAADAGQLAQLFSQAVYGGEALPRDVVQATLSRLWARLR